MAAVTIWFIELPNSGSAIRDSDKSQLAVGCTLTEEVDPEIDYFRNSLNDVTNEG